MFYYSPYREADQWIECHEELELNSVHGNVRSYHDTRIRIGEIEYNAANTPGLWGSIPFCIEVKDGVFLTCVRMNCLALFTFHSRPDGLVTASQFRPPRLELFSPIHFRSCFTIATWWTLAARVTAL